MLLLTFFKPILTALGDGRVIRTAVAWILRGLAVLVLVIGLIGALAGLVLAFQSRGATILAGIITSVVFAGAVLTGFQILWACSQAVAALGDSSFTVTPILGLLCRSFGELSAVSLTALGLAACLTTWITALGPVDSGKGFLSEVAPSDALSFLRPLGGGFWGGLAVLVVFLILAFLALVFAYFMAEFLVVLVDIARNIREVRAVAERAAPLALANSQPTAPVPPPVPTPAPKPQPVPPQVQILPPAPEPVRVQLPPVCGGCGSPLEAGVRFCEACGNRVM